MDQILGSEFVCTECGHSFKNAKGLQGHMRLSHNRPTMQSFSKDYVDDALEKMMHLLEVQNEEIVKLKGDQSAGSQIVCQDCGQYLGRNALEVEEMKSCPKCGGFHGKILRNGISPTLELEKRIIVVGRLVESVMDALVKVDDRIQFCEDDIKGLKYIGVKPNEFTLNHVREVKK